MRIAAAIISTAFVLSYAPRAEAKFAGSKVADAKPGDVRVIATAAIREPLEAVLKRAEAAIGKPIVAEYGSARGNLRDKIVGGQDFEVAMLLPDVDDELEAVGKIAPGRFEIARVPVGFGLRGEAPHLDVRSPAGVKAAMLDAKSVKYAPVGAAVMTVKKILATLEIADNPQIHERRPAPDRQGRGLGRQQQHRAPEPPGRHHRLPEDQRGVRRRRLRQPPRRRVRGRHRRL
jgi:hypothetical protein